jgi:hypothetical protein
VNSGLETLAWGVLAAEVIVAVVVFAPIEAIGAALVDLFAAFSFGKHPWIRGN